MSSPRSRDQGIVAYSTISYIGPIYCPECKKEGKLKPTGIPHTYRCNNCSREYVAKGRKLVRAD